MLKFADDEYRPESKEMRINDKPLDATTAILAITSGMAPVTIQKLETALLKDPSVAAYLLEQPRIAETKFWKLLGKSGAVLTRKRKE